MSIFHKQSCAFGFVTHLFGTEIKALFSEEIVPRGVTFRISPTSYSELLNGDEPVSTLTQDFHTRLDNLLRTLVHAKPHFIRCIRPNQTESSSEFKRGFVVDQVRSLQILETVNLMAGGFPHRMRFKNFNSRYRTLAPIRTLSRSDELALEDCQKILDHLKPSLRSSEPGTISKDWALGKKHIFLSEGARQHLEKLRNENRARSARLIQTCWRGYSVRKKWPSLRSSLQSHCTAQKSAKLSRPRPQPISGTPPPDALQNGLFLGKGRQQGVVQLPLVGDQGLQHNMISKRFRKPVLSLGWTWWVFTSTSWPIIHILYTLHIYFILNIFILFSCNQTHTYITPVLRFIDKIIIFLEGIIL